MKTVSVIIVSHGRHEALTRCLLGVGQLFYPEFEIVVVADSAAAKTVETGPMAGRIKIVRFDEENISKARNLGLAEAAGEIVAFIDDDAVPEPTWLNHLIAAFDDPEVSAAGGFVRGRNGVSMQWRASSVDHAGTRHPIAVDSDKPVVLHPAHGRAIKTEGTNMAFRRDVMAEMGGFDPAFRFFLDETDLNIRLAQAGHATAIVPLAEVHHGFAASARRRQDRVPRDLFEIGASYAAFLLRHCPEPERAQHQAAFVGEQRKRVIQHMIAGRLEPRDVRRLLNRLRQGLAKGAKRVPKATSVIPMATHGFMVFSTKSAQKPKLLSGRHMNCTKLRQQAEQDVANGRVTTLMLFSATALFGQVRFTSNGYWEHRGGVFGKMSRNEPLFKLRTLKDKIASEVTRVANQRGMS